MWGEKLTKNKSYWIDLYAGNHVSSVVLLVNYASIVMILQGYFWQDNSISSTAFGHFTKNNICINLFFRDAPLRHSHLSFSTCYDQTWSFRLFKLFYLFLYISNNIRSLSYGKKILLLLQNQEHTMWNWGKIPAYDSARCAGWKVRTIYCSLHRHSGETNGVNQRMGQHWIGDEHEDWRYWRWSTGLKQLLESQTFWTWDRSEVLRSKHADRDTKCWQMVFLHTHAYKCLPRHRLTFHREQTFKSV